MADTWKLRCELHGHEQDVRAICAFSDSTLATCSRDKSIRVWEPVCPLTSPSDVAAHLWPRILRLSAGTPGDTFKILAPLVPRKSRSRC